MKRLFRRLNRDMSRLEVAPLYLLAALVAWACVLTALMTLLSASAAGQPWGLTPPRRAPRPDVFVFLLDDVGLADLDAVETPTVDALRAGGVDFRRAYAHPWCAPTRDSLVFGGWGGLYRGAECDPPGPRTVPVGAPSLAHDLDTAGFRTALVGKWHLGTNDVGLEWPYTPLLHGFDHWYAGYPTPRSCLPPGQAVYDGLVYAEPSHPTGAQVKAAWRLIDEASMWTPLFVLVSFTDAHEPWEKPPTWLMPPGWVWDPNLGSRERFEEEVRSLDGAIYWVLEHHRRSGRPRPWVVVLGDNGTPQKVAPAPQHAKKTVFELGVLVPMVWNGPGLAPGVSRDPVSVVDLWPSLADGLGLGAPGGGDGVSLVPYLTSGLPPRPWAYVRNPGTGARAVVERRWKLRQFGPLEELYDLLLDPAEARPLPAVGPDADRLRATLAGLP